MINSLQTFRRRGTYHVRIRVGWTWGSAFASGLFVHLLADEINKVVTWPDLSTRKS